MGWKPGNPKLFLLNILWCNPIFTSFYHLSASRRWRHNRRTKTKVQKQNPRWFNGISGWSNGIWLFDGDLIRFSTNWDGLEIMVWKAPGDFSAFPIPWPLGVPVVTHHLPGEWEPGARWPSEMRCSRPLVAAFSPEIWKKQGTDPQPSCHLCPKVII